MLPALLLVMVFTAKIKAQEGGGNQTNQESGGEDWDCNGTIFDVNPIRDKVILD